jgi:hypothetical protein
MSRGGFDGDQMTRSWNQEPIATDSDKHSPDIANELAALRPFEDAYMDAVADGLGVRHAHAPASC